MAITDKHIKSILEEIAALIVFKKNKLVVAMNKSNIQTVSTATENNVLANQVIEGLTKNAEFVKNLSALITDENLSDLLQKKKLNSTGENSESIGADFGKKIQSLIIAFSQSIGASKKQKDLIKSELKLEVERCIQKKEEQDKEDKWVKRTKRWSGVGITLLVLGSIALVGISIHGLKKYKGE